MKNYDVREWKFADNWNAGRRGRRPLHTFAMTDFFVYTLFSCDNGYPMIKWEQNREYFGRNEP